MGQSPLKSSRFIVFNSTCFHCSKDKGKFFIFFKPTFSAKVNLDKNFLLRFKISFSVSFFVYNSFIIAFLFVKDDRGLVFIMNFFDVILGFFKLIPNF